ncbi:MAG: EamA family transporter RarD [Eubacteriales bacterium]|nr:EamA family transporter RarD [Eubacteriales bacterium]MDD3199784.1 EamA family transporter RarD [Eubacteriales bacterium]MDD4630050.1 EamA family transporter RarD [Eubacteriales bacterium]
MNQDNTEKNGRINWVNRIRSSHDTRKVNTQREYKQGIASAILCALLWGGLPIYWKSLDPIDPILILFYRIVLACIFSFIMAIIFYPWEVILRPLKNKGTIRTFFLSGTLISLNWGIYIWAVSNDHIIQTSIGYYIEPLIVCVFGVLLFKEKLNIYKLIAIIFATLAIAVILIYHGKIPGIALSLAFTFSTYAAIKKKLRVDAVLSLLYETLFLLPVAVPVILYYELTGKGAFENAEPVQWGLLALAGILTGTPLMLFAMAANRISLITLGITQYVSPTMALLLGAFVYREPFDMIQLVAFGFIWVGIGIFTAGEIMENRIIIEEAGQGSEQIRGNENDK